MYSKDIYKRFNYFFARVVGAKNIGFIFRADISVIDLKNTRACLIKDVFALNLCADRVLKYKFTRKEV